jgi:hypothetical protein
MKTILPIFRKSSTITALILLAAFSLSAQPFNSGSDGSYGPMNITNNTILDLPTNGIFNCTTITVGNGVTLRFNRNALNTPVYLLATGDVTVSGTIDLSGGPNSGGAPGLGGPGGFDGGYGGFGIGANTKGGDGQGPGGGKSFGGRCYNVNWNGVFASPASQNGNVYGNALLSPLIGGSGGAGGDGNPGLGGGGGGGAILVASNTRITIGGQLLANGGGVPTCCYADGGGSGGAIRVVSPTVSGSGILTTSGGAGDCGSGSPGRIRIDCQDAYSFRSLVMNGVATRGAQMFVFPSLAPRLDILQAAGQLISEGTNNAVVVTLPSGSPTNQTVTVQARDFLTNVNITVSVVPENRPSATYLATITMTNNPSQVTVPVVIPDGTISRIYSWTR